MYFRDKIKYTDLSSRSPKFRLIKWTETRHSADSSWVLIGWSDGSAPVFLMLIGSRTAGAVLRRDQVYYGTISTDKVHHLPSSQSLFISLEGAVVDVGVDGCHRWWVSTLPSPWYIPARDEIRSLTWSPHGPTKQQLTPHVIYVYY